LSSRYATRKRKMLVAGEVGCDATRRGGAMEDELGLVYANSSSRETNSRR
jgi:hypothetical protein